MSERPDVRTPHWRRNVVWGLGGIATAAALVGAGWLFFPGF